jgi:O-succinylbenzoate synthase
MRVDEVELRVVSLPFRSPVRTSYGTESHKVAVLATVRSEGIEGYGEGAMERLPLYREETVEGALALLRQALVPWVLGHEITHPEVLTDAWRGWRGNPMAKATLEHAVWDCYARQQGLPLSKVLGGSGDAVPVGASLGMAPVSETVERVARHLDEGYQRIKLKIEPGSDIDVLAAVRAEFPDASLSADANSAYSLADADHLRILDTVGLTYLEQPLHWDDLVEHAALAGILATPLCLDESLTSYERTAAALDLGACAVVNLKSARVGGHAVARRISELCVARSVPMWCGGMYELGVGRAHNIHLATLPGFTLPGDTASASRTYERDIVKEPLEASDGWMPVPAGPGIGVTLDRPILERVTSSAEVHGRSHRDRRTP